MSDQFSKVKRMNMVLWAAQILLAAFLLAGTWIKFLPAGKAAAIGPWMGQVPVWVVRLLGITDLLGGIGLILPGLLRIKPRLTVWAAYGTVLLMGCAIVFHLSRGEGAVIVPNIIALLIAVFIGRGRSVNAGMA